MVSNSSREVTLLKTVFTLIWITVSSSVKLALNNGTLDKNSVSTSRNK